MVIARNMPADELQAMIATAQTDLDAAGESPFIRRDPYRIIISALSEILAVFGRSITRWERAVADIIAARDPLPEADRVALKAEIITAAEDGAFRGMRKEAQRMVRTMDRRLSAQIGLAVGGAFVLGAVATLAVVFLAGFGPFSREAQNQAAWRDLMLVNPDPRPALSNAAVQADRTGRRFYSGLRLWLDPVRPPPASE